MKKVSLFILFLSPPACAFFWSPSSAPAENSAQVGETQEFPPSTCGAQMRLPLNYQANFSLGQPDIYGDEKSLDDMRNSGYTFAEYMKSENEASRNTAPALGAKFRNFRKKTLEMYWDDGTHPGMYSGTVSAMGRTATTTYVGHAFKFVDPDTKELIVRLEMRADTTMYIIEPEESDIITQTSTNYLTAKAESEYYKNYYLENGIPWLSMHNRPKPVLNMWPAERMGQQHTIISPASFWLNEKEQTNENVALNLTVISKAPEGPRVFLIEDLLSPYECDHIVQEGQSVVRPSAVGTDGGFKSRTRTSENGWLRRSRTPILETVHRRFADVLGLDEGIVHSNGVAEELQVVRYEIGQQYQPHHDFSDTGIANQRFLTLLLYVNTPDEGGGTSFPKANNGRGLRVKPPRGSGVLFYSMLPDGNGDDLSLHAGEPVIKGRKWVCNLWIWDPKR